VEIINDALVVPRRFSVVLRLVSALPAPTKQEVSHLTQLPVILDNASGLPKNSLAASENTCKHAINYEQISESNEKVLSLRVDHEQISTMLAFQDHMRQVLLGITAREQANFLFNLFSAWYAAQDEKVLFSYDQCPVSFSTDMTPYFPKPDDRLFNSTKLNAWRQWAAFLGLGWEMKFGSRMILVPDATKRVKAILPEIFHDTKRLRFHLFIERLAELCPELDNGELFTYCWKASRGGVVRGNRLSLMLSTALRTLAASQEIQLTREADALDVWQLYPNQSSVYQQVTHIHWQGSI
jgi:hypothetical protein